jgi:ABC-type oligopeptide transport system ATPase subunit
MVVLFDQVTMLFDDDYDQHNKDDHEYLIEFPNQLVTKIKKKNKIKEMLFLYELVVEVELIVFHRLVKLFRM